MFQNNKKKISFEIFFLCLFELASFQDPDTIVGVVEEMLIKGKSLDEKPEDDSVDDKRDNDYHEPIYYTDDDEHDDKYDDETIMFRDEL